MKLKKIAQAKNTARFFGRISETKGQRGTFFNWSGSGFVFRFKGSSAAAYLLCGAEHDAVPEDGGQAYLGVFVDGLPFAVARFPLRRKEGWYTLVENLPDGEHTVSVVKQTEVGNGRAAVTELAVDGEFLGAPEPKKIQLEFIGDSITCGYGNLGSAENNTFLTAEEDFSRTYAAAAAQLLDAELSCVAASGNGFYHDYGCNTHNLIPELYRYIDKMLDEHCGNPPQKWDFSSDRRDAVILKLGQNDAQYCSGTDLPESRRTAAELKARREAFEETAFSFFRQLLEVRKGIPLFLVYESDMYLWEPLLSAAQRAGNIHLVCVEPKQEYEGVGANGHWSVHTHARAAIQLAKRIREVLC